MSNFIMFLKSFKNHLPAQASLEYVIIMAVLIGLITVWLAGLFPGLRDNLEANFFTPAVNKIVSDEGGGYSPAPSGPAEPNPPAERDYGI